LGLEQGVRLQFGAQRTAADAQKRSRPRLISLYVIHDLSQEWAFNFSNHQIVEIHRDLAIKIGEVAFQGRLYVCPKRNAGGAGHAAARRAP